MFTYSQGSILLYRATINTVFLRMSHACSRVGMNACVCFGMGSHIMLAEVEQVIGSGSHEQWDVWQPGVVGKCMEI